MGGFLSELGKKLAERWLSLLVLPGLLLLATLAAAQTLGQRHSVEATRLIDRVNAWTTDPATGRAGTVALVLSGVVLAAAGLGVLAQALGSLTERLWFAENWPAWPWPLRHMAQRRVKCRAERWRTATDAYQQRLDQRRQAHVRGQHSLGASSLDLARAGQAVTRIASEQPARPTWIGDRIHAVVVRMHRDYQLDVATVWPPLWLTVPETTRAEITSAREAFTRAAALFGWGLLYLPVFLLWWPGLVLAGAITLTAWRRARGTAEAYARLVEAALRVHTPALAWSVGLDHKGPLNPQTGWALTCLLQGQSHLVELTTGWPTSSPDAEDEAADHQGAAAGGWKTGRADDPALPGDSGGASQEATPTSLTKGLGRGRPGWPWRSSS